ncbi:MAG: metalloregulator ArsR/SmtB family transcription factor [Bacteroidota bacterium]
MDSREFKDTIYSGVAKMLKALANPARLEIIEMLSQGEKNVEGVVETTNLTFANASQHLQVLKHNNLVKSRKEGHYAYYSLMNDEVLELYQFVTKYAVNEIAEVEKTLNRQRKDHEALNPVNLNDLELMINAEHVMLMDVRPKVEYELGHIDGAVSAPINELLCCLKNFSREKEIIAYCRGPFCVLADEAVKVLREKGFKVRRMDDGYPEWKIKQVKSKRNQTL